MNMLRASSDLFCRKVCFAVVFFLREDDCENGVGPAAGLVHVGGSHGSGRWDQVRKQHNLEAAAALVIEVTSMGLVIRMELLLMGWCVLWWKYCFMYTGYSITWAQQTRCGQRERLGGDTGCSRHVLEISFLTQQEDWGRALSSQEEVSWHMHASDPLILMSSLGFSPA